MQRDLQTTLRPGLQPEPKFFEAVQHVPSGSHLFLLLGCAAVGDGLGCGSDTFGAADKVPAMGTELRGVQNLYGPCPLSKGLQITLRLQGANDAPGIAFGFPAEVIGYFLMGRANTAGSGDRGANKLIGPLLLSGERDHGPSPCRSRI
jgi:hypothetical protein